MIPLAWLPQMPSACTELVLGDAVGVDRHGRRREAARERRRMVVPSVKAPGTASPTRHITSTPAIVAVSIACPEAPTASPTASAVVTATEPVCTIASSRAVVEVEAVGKRPVGEDGVRCADPGRAADQRALARPAQTLRRPEHGAAEVLARRGEAVPDDVEHQELGAVDDGGRDATPVEAEDEAREQPGGRGRGHRALPATSARG